MLLRELTDDQSGCLFCQIVSGKAPSYSVFEDEVSIAFLDTRPLIPGHCLLIPKKHYQTLADLPATLVAALFRSAQLLTRAVEQAVEAEGSFVAINNKVSQSVPHLHIHIVPRRRGDGLKGFFWPRQRYADENALVGMQETVRSAVESLRR